MVDDLQVNILSKVSCLSKQVFVESNHDMLHLIKSLHITAPIISKRVDVR